MVVIFSMLFIGIGKALFDMAYTGDEYNSDTFRFTITSTEDFYNE